MAITSVSTPHPAPKPAATMTHTRPLTPPHPKSLSGQDQKNQHPLTTRPGHHVNKLV
jgi:hypothetical protein